MERQEAWNILGLQPGASGKDIRDARNRLARTYHRDHHQDLSDDTPMERVNDAYHTLAARGFRAKTEAVRRGTGVSIFHPFYPIVFWCDFGIAVIEGMREETDRASRT